MVTEIQYSNKTPVVGQNYWWHNDAANRMQSTYFVNDQTKATSSPTCTGHPYNHQSYRWAEWRIVTDGTGGTASFTNVGCNSGNFDLLSNYSWTNNPSTVAGTYRIIYGNPPRGSPQPLTYLEQLYKLDSDQAGVHYVPRKARR